MSHAPSAETMTRNAPPRMEARSTPKSDDGQSAHVSAQPARETLFSDMMFDHTSNTDPFVVAVDPIALITTECVAVTSAMRKHARWAHSSVSAILGGSGA